MSCANARRIVNIGWNFRQEPYYNYLALLDAWTESKSLSIGKSIHQHILKHNHCNDNNSNLLDKLTRFYISCSRIDLARHVFDEIPNTDRNNKTILWNQMIRAYAWNGPFEKAVDLYYEMVESGVRPTNYTYPFVIKACSAMQDVENGVKIHEHVKRHGLDGDVYICTALVDFYAKCGLLVEARQVFDGMWKRDIVAWNAMISGCSVNGLCLELMGLVFEMQENGLTPNSSTIVAILPAIAEANKLREGKAVHGYSTRRGFVNDVVVDTGILDVYAKCGLLNYAKRIFRVMTFKNEITWSAMIGAYITCDSTQEGLELFGHMRVEDTGSPSPVMLATVIRACAKLNDLRRGRKMHGYTVKSGSNLDLMVSNTLLSMYAKCGRIDDALNFFEEMGLKDSVSFSAIIAGCVQNGHAEEALQIFQMMQSSGVQPESATVMGILPACSHLAALQLGVCTHGYSIVRGFTEDVSICNALIDMYSKCGKVNIARIIFDKMNKRDVVSWNAMIAGYGVHGHGKEAISLFYDMQTVAQKPDEITFIGLLFACSHSGLVAEGKYWFFSMCQEFKISPRMDHYLCMVDLLGRAGLLDEAYGFIQNMPFKPDVRIWSALLAACRIHKHIVLAEEVSNKIQYLGPESPGNFVLLSNLYTTAGRWDDAAHIRIKQKDSGFKKSPGCSWIEINGVVHAFAGGDQSHPQSTKINEKLKEISTEMKKLGYSAESSFVYQDVEEEEKEQILLYHSEKLAVAFALLNLEPSKSILVTKNLRVCVDCHSTLKYVTLITKREITVRDASRFHHFRDGICSCGDFW
ncbi:PREDICTED: pentatricopeptide repeat-containing protein At3g16610 [Nicotiana attenuata]|uniref:Pentatricopeptide repeat-containing protein n=1 Tax=Nicotiana attenuata TaxID=49451 RepID=A0A314L8V4_NICAT|nr:PREDICTED: pentatricopeptide repeat-containing protein At3g16610 [Nicotiana attenuata]OIT37998.1 pentatricopeptide repeat-containing protein [Nicotiana attenuata]